MFFSSLYETSIFFFFFFQKIITKIYDQIIKFNKASKRALAPLTNMQMKARVRIFTKQLSINNILYLLYHVLE